MPHVSCNLIAGGAASKHFQLLMKLPCRMNVISARSSRSCGKSDSCRRLLRPLWMSSFRLALASLGVPHLMQLPIGLSSAACISSNGSSRAASARAVTFWQLWPQEMMSRRPRFPGLMVWTAACLFQVAICMTQKAFRSSWTEQCSSNAQRLLTNIVFACCKPSFKSRAADHKATL